MTNLTAHKSPAPTADWLVAQYAMGQLPRAAAVLTEAYLEMNPSMRPAAERIEQIGGWSLETAKPVAMRAGVSASDVLTRLDQSSNVEPLAAAPAVEMSSAPRLPHSLLDAVGRPIASIPWKWRGMGAYEYRVSDLEDEGIVARLLRIEPGRAVPQHTHVGLEATLVLTGAYVDEAGRFGPGDLELANDDVDHKPVAERGETCICFAVTESPMKLTGTIGRMFQSLL